jgi:transcriptional regulator with XRE-family HTH domain
MTKDCENRYKISRETAGLTQAQASELLHVSERSLSDYENGRTTVPDDVVKSMANTYSTPILAWWHIKNGVLGEFLPDIFLPQTGGDMAFQLILAEDELSPAVGEIKRIVADGQIDDSERADFTNSVKALKQVNGRATRSRSR